MTKAYRSSERAREWASYWWARYPRAWREAHHWRDYEKVIGERERNVKIVKEIRLRILRDALGRGKE